MAWFRGVPPAAPGVKAARTGVLLVNLGTPTAPTYWPIRRYLWSFLGDLRVVEACPYYWYPLLLGPILTFRPRKTAKLYREIWTPEGSPLLVYTAGLAARLAERFAGDDVSVEFGMSYGDPNLSAAIERLLGGGAERLLVVPLYPQYSGSTSGAVFDGVVRELSRYRVVPELRFARDYHDDPDYIAALAASVRASFAATGETHLVCSYHGIPAKYVTNGDPYRAQAERTTELLVAALGLDPSHCSMSFQSRFGPTEWIKPYTDEHLADLVRRGVRRVTVVTPAFAVDCLETLEEIAVGSREKFLAAGGEAFTLVPALNDSPGQVGWLERFVRRHTAGWPGLGALA
jgi:protoporphyrin/coproporphyrin ferrochelatase